MQKKSWKLNDIILAVCLGCSLLKIDIEFKNERMKWPAAFVFIVVKVENENVRLLW